MGNLQLERASADDPTIIRTDPKKRYGYMTEGSSVLDLEPTDTGDGEEDASGGLHGNTPCAHSPVGTEGVTFVTSELINLSRHS